MASEVACIVAGVAPTPRAEAALERAAWEARQKQARLVLVGHVERPRGEQAAEGYASERQEREQELEERARGFRESGLEVTVEVPAGMPTPAESILLVAERERADLLVIGGRRRSRVGKLLLGSNVQDILLGAGCPVLYVKTDDAAS